MILFSERLDSNFERAIEAAAIDETVSDDVRSLSETDLLTVLSVTVEH